MLLNIMLWFYKSVEFTLGSTLNGGSDGKASAYNVGDPGSIPELGRPLEKEMATHSNIFAYKMWKS